MTAVHDWEGGHFFWNLEESGEKGGKQVEKMVQDMLLLPNKNIGNLIMLKESGDLKGNPDKEVFLAGDSRMMRERHAVVSFSYLLYSGDKSISPMKV